MKFKPVYFLVFSLALFIVAWFLMSTTGLRGTDQYWYWAAVRSIVEKGEFTSNTVLPAAAYTGHFKGSPFIHNIPQVYLASIPAFLLGYKWGWSVFNLVCFLGHFYFVYKILLNLELKNSNALFVTALWILFPLNLWSGFQPNSESFLILVLSVLLYLTTSKKLYKEVYLFYLFGLLLGFFLQIRLNYVILLIALPLLYRRVKFNNKYFHILVNVILLVLTYKVFSLILPGAGKGELIDMIKNNHESAPMLGFYNYNYPNITIGQILDVLPLKILNAFKTQFFSKDLLSLIVFSIYNLLIATTVYLSLKSAIWKKYKMELIIVLLFFLVHMATAVLAQNQVRYFYIHFGLSLILILSILIKEYDFIRKLLSNNLLIWLFTAVAFTGLVYGFYQKVQREALNDFKHMEQLSKCVLEAGIEKNENVWLKRQDAFTSFVLFPRLVFSVHPSIVLPPKKYLDVMLKNTEPKCFIDNSPEEWDYQSIFNDSSLNPQKCGNLTFFRLQDKFWESSHGLVPDDSE